MMTQFHKQILIKIYINLCFVFIFNINETRRHENIKFFFFMNFLTGENLYLSQVHTSATYFIKLNSHIKPMGYQ